jgi:hypothetical protein
MWYEHRDPKGHRIYVPFSFWVYRSIARNIEPMKLVIDILYNYGS